MNPVTNTPDAVLAEAAEPTDALDALLRQIIGGYFVLTDGQGSVSKWSEPAELLFGTPAENILGHGFFESLIGEALPPEGHAWRGFLATGEPPKAPGTVQLSGRRSDGDVFPLEAVFVPVKLDEGFDFSLFLEDLSFELPMNLMLLRMRQQHPVVVRALGQALEPEAQPWEGWRTAGTLVVFRPLSATPWVEAELARRESERAAADAEAEERLTNPDPGIQGGVADLDDAAAVVARLLSALERIDELERVAGGLPAQLEETRKESDQRAEALRADVQRALAAAPSELDRHEEKAKLAAAESAATRLGERIDRLERDRAQADARLAEAVAAAEARAVEAIAESGRRFEAARAGLEARLGSVDVSAQLEQVRAEHEEAAQAARVELATTIERLERDREREREAARAELATALERVEQVARGGDAVREQLSSLTVERAGLSGDDQRRLGELQRETEALRARVEELADREALDAHFMATAAQVAEMRDVVARNESSAAELAARVTGELAELRETVAATDVGELRAAVAALESAPDLGADVSALREALARHEAATAELAAAPAPDLTPLHDALARQEAEGAELKRLLAEQQAFSSAVERQLAALQTQISQAEVAAGRAPEAAAVERQVQTMVGDTQRQIAALHARLAVLADTGRAVEELRRRLDALGELHASQVELSARLDGAARAEDLTALGARVDELATLRERLDGAARAEDLAALRDELTGRDDVSALHERLDGFAGRDELASLAARADLEALSARIDELGGDEALALAQEALGKIAQVDRGAGTVLADVRALREAVEGGRADAARLSGELEVTRGQADRAEAEALSAHEAAAAAGEAAGAAREDAAKAREEASAARLEVDGQRERTTLLADQITGVREAATSARSDAAAARTAAESLEERLTAVDQRAAALRTEVGAGRERLDAVSAEAEQAGEALRSELGEVREIAETTARGLDALRAELAGVREAAEAARAGEERIEAMQAELNFALTSLDELKQGLSSAGQAAVIARREAEQARKAAQHAGDGSTERVTEVFQQILGLAASRNAQNARRHAPAPAPPKPEASEREARHGFDDVAAPMAILTLDGKFKELNPAFTKLVGYKEHEFAKAAWPSPHDRRDYKDQLEQLRRMGAGELREIAVQSTYMHGQGLMVPVVGKLTVEHGEDGLPLHLVLEAEDRHTA